MAMRDTDVEQRGDALLGQRIVLGITGGIAAVDSVRLARALRREGAELTVIMTNAAQRIITPLPSVGPRKPRLSPTGTAT